MRKRPSMAEAGIFDKTADVLDFLAIGDNNSSLNGVELEQVLVEADVPVESLPIGIVHPRPQQIRKYFDPDKLARLMESIKSLNQITDPLLVRPHPTRPDEYELLAGHRRREAALKLKFTHIPVKIFKVSDETAAEIAAASNLQREDLNPLEETDGILELLSLKLHKSQDDVIRLFYQLGNQGKTKNNVVLSPEWQVVESVFSSVARITPETFRVQRLPLLNLPEEVIEALREGRIEYTKARAIARVKDQAQRQKLLNEALTHDLSKREIDEQVKSLRTSRSGVDPLPDRMRDTYQRIKASKVWQDPKKRKQLEKLLVQLEALMD